MKNNSRQVLTRLMLVIAIGLVFSLIFSNVKQGKQLQSTKEELSKLEQQLRIQRELLKGDTLMVEGKYQDALQQYENQEMIPIQDGSFGVGLRMAMAQKFLDLEEGLENHTRNADSLVEMEVDTETEPVAGGLNQVDSLNFALEKTKVQLARLKTQLQEKSFGEYISFTNAKGSKLHYVGQVKQGKANGYGVAILNTGSRYIGEWQNNERHGYGTYYWKDGEYYEGEYRNDQRNGQGTYYWPNGEKYVGQWKADQRSGKGAFYGKDGKLMASGVWENDKMIVSTTKKNKQKKKDIAALSL